MGVFLFSETPELSASSYPSAYSVRAVLKTSYFGFYLAAVIKLSRKDIVTERRFAGVLYLNMVKLRTIAAITRLDKPHARLANF